MTLTVMLAVSMSLVSGGKPSSADALTTRDLGRVSLSVPAVWKATTADGTRTYEAPSKDASFSLDAFPWDGDPKIAPDACVEKLTHALGDELAWNKVTIGGAPAAYVIFSERLADKSSVQRRTYVGCDGKTKWVLTFTYAEKKVDRFAPVAEAVAKSLQYK